MHLLLCILCLFTVHCVVFGKQINIGFINEARSVFLDKAISFDENIQQKKLRALALDLVLGELKKSHPNTSFRVKDCSSILDKNKVLNFDNAIETLIHNDNIHIFLGPFSSENLNYPHVRKTIENKNVAFVSLPNLYFLRKLKNYYTPLEWSDVGIKLAFDESKKSFKTNYPLKIAAFLLNSDSSRDTYDVVKKMVPSVFEKHLFQVPELLSYTNKLDEKIKEVLAYNPDIILNSNFNEISLDIVARTMKEGFQGVFLDSNTWGCGPIIKNYFKSKMKDLETTSVGYKSSQFICPEDTLKDEKDFRIKILQREAYYYSEIGLLYKTLKHTLNAIIKSSLPITRENIHKIIQDNSYFNGFSGVHFNLFKRKDSPEFLSLYKLFFQKEFIIKKIPNPIDIKNKDEKH